MTDPLPQLHVFFSAKGGVGKSTLALACARIAARREGSAALLDLDFTGTSLADGLRLQAPDLPMAQDGALDLHSSGDVGLLSPGETRRRRWRRLGASRPARFLPYLNDAFTQDADGLRPELLAWRAEPDDGVCYFPSSALAPDIQRVVEMNFYQPDPLHWPARLNLVLHRLAERLPHVHTFVVDLPPGIFGFTYAALSLFARLQPGAQLPEELLLDSAARQWRVRAYLVTSPDHSDLLSALSHPILYRNQLRTLIPLVNRATRREGLRQWIRQQLPPTLNLDRRLQFVDEEPLLLGRVFQDESFDLEFLSSARPETLNALERLFGWNGGGGA